LPSPNLKFKTIFLSEAESFISKLDRKIARKIIYNIDLAEKPNDPRLFKKIEHDRWEFRTHYNGIQIRLLAFWDHTSSCSTLVVAIHGFVKISEKVPIREIERALKLKHAYFSKN